MLSSGTRITIVLLVGLLVATAGYWIFLADPGPDPLAGVEDDGFFDGGPTTDSESMRIDPFAAARAETAQDPSDSVVEGTRAGGTEHVEFADGSDEHARTGSDPVRSDSAIRFERDDSTWHDAVGRPWETLRRVSPTGPVRVRENGEFGSDGTSRPTVGGDDRDPDGGKGDPPVVVAPPDTAPIPAERDEVPAQPVQPATDGGSAGSGDGDGWGEHVVAMGETVVAIAEAWFGEPAHWDLLLRANPGIDPTRLAIGQRLRLPPRGWRPSPPSPAPTGETIHEVRPSETLSEISRQHYGSAEHWRWIYEANRETIGADPGRLKVGMRLRIPPRASGAS